MEGLCLIYPSLVKCHCREIEPGLILPEYVLQWDLFYPTIILLLRFQNPKGLFDLRISIWIKQKP